MIGSAGIQRKGTLPTVCVCGESILQRCLSWPWKDREEAADVTEGKESWEGMAHRTVTTRGLGVGG